MKEKVYLINATARVSWCREDFDSEEEFEAFVPTNDDVIQNAKDLDSWDYEVVKEE